MFSVCFQSQGKSSDGSFINCLTGCSIEQSYKELERETGFEPATSTLARLHSTAELFPQQGKSY